MVVVQISKGKVGWLQLTQNIPINIISRIIPLEYYMNNICGKGFKWPTSKFRIELLLFS